MNTQHTPTVRERYEEKFGWAGSSGTFTGIRDEEIVKFIIAEREAGVKMYDGFKNMKLAPKTGTTIYGLYEDGTIIDIFWSERPVCMLGPVNGGYPEGWATGGDDTDYNLPMDEPLAWKEHELTSEDK